MALKKTINTNIGLPADYHKILRFLVAEDKGTENYKCSVSVGTYINQEARNNGAMTILEKTFSINVSLFELENTPVLKLLYKKLKNFDEFKDAEDVLN